MRLQASYIVFFFIFSGFIIVSSGNLSGIIHKIIVNHPAFGEDDPTEFNLQELRKDSHTLQGYFLDAESVICVDHSCKIVPVRMFWDPVGNYLKYELSDGVILEKKEGEPFLPEDYDRLHDILMDKSSPYSGLTYYEITHKKVMGEGDIDGMTGATAILLDESKTVLGGAWTCYTLWHWAHGETVQEIRRITGASSSRKDLLMYLESANVDETLFALNEITKRKDIDTTVVNSVVKLGQDAGRNSKTYKKVLSYLEMSDDDLYYRSLKQLVKYNSADRRKLLWNSILMSKKIPTVSYFDSFVDKILKAKDYQEIDLFLNVLERKNSSSPTLIKKMIPLLEDEFSILNRRVYWFLEQEELSTSQSKVMQSYFLKYSDYL